MKLPSASLAKGRSGRVKVMAGLLSVSTGEPISAASVQTFGSALAFHDAEASQIGPRRVPIGGELARHSIILIGFADVAELLVRHRPAIMGERGALGIMLQRDREQL